MANEKAKSRTPKLVLVILIASGFLIAMAAVFFAPRGEITGDPMLGSEAPDFDVKTADGKSASLSDFRGKVVLVNFWAFWCEPCRDEMASLKALEAQLASQDFALLLVHLGDEKEEALQVPNLPSRVFFDIAPSILGDYGVMGLPHSVLIDRKGVLREVYLGPQNWTSAEILKQIQGAG